MGLGGGWLGVDVTSVMSHCSKLENTLAVYMPDPWGPLGRGGRATRSLLRPLLFWLLLDPLTPFLSVLPTPVVSQSPLVLPKPRRGKRDRRNLRARSINLSCRRVNLSPAGLSICLRLTITASNGKNAFFHVSAAQGAISADSTQ